MKDSHIIAGLHSVRTALKHGASAVDEVWVDGSRHDRRIKEIIELARGAGIRVNTISREEMDGLQPDLNHQGVAARSRAVAAKDEGVLKQLLADLDGPPLLLILDGVQDPHNLGACLRSADGAGVHAIIAPKDRSVGLTPTACKVASGAAECVPFIQVTNLSRTLRWLQNDAGVWLTGTAGEAEKSIYEADLTGPMALVMGGEEKGLRRLTREACDQLVKIPMAGDVESLNVSVATAVCLFEAVRQRAL
jgi:23S rRNA (guanosine2251-2'-O)-methyltransferase